MSSKDNNDQNMINFFISGGKMLESKKTVHENEEFEMIPLGQYYNFTKYCKKPEQYCSEGINKSIGFT
jgi:hypothetical protein